MIPRSLIPLQPKPWQTSFREVISNTGDLLTALKLDIGDFNLIESAEFPLRVPQSYLSRIHPGDPNDPLLLQILPRRLEQEDQIFTLNDPLEESRFSRSSGLIKKYQGRALILASSNCAIHCRYCFRRGSACTTGAVAPVWDEIWSEISSDNSITEVVLSGGDPLMLSTRRLEEIFLNCNSISHLKRIRIHSRVPVAFPERIDTELLACLSDTPKPMVLVLHCNHDQEIDTSVLRVTKDLTQAGVTLLNQAVLLKGINNSVATQIRLSESLFDCGVQPYYLHLLDQVRGVSHFDVPQTEALRLYRTLIEKLPGYLVPRLVRENPGQPSKTPVSPY